MATRLGELNIQFYNNYDVSIDIKAPHDHKLITELSLLSVYIIRQASDLGGMPDLAYALRRVKDGSLKEFDIGDHLIANDVDITVPRIVKSRWGKTKSFKAELLGTEYKQENILSMNLKPSGFGIMGSEVRYYVYQSINALIRYFALEYRHNKNIIEMFQDVIYLLGDLCDDREVIAAGNIAGQGRAVNQLLDEVWH